MGGFSSYKLMYILLSAKSMAYFCKKYRDRSGRCIAILFKRIGVRGRFHSSNSYNTPLSRYPMQLLALSLLRDRSPRVAQESVKFRGLWKRLPLTTLLRLPMLFRFKSSLCIHLRAYSKHFWRHLVTRPKYTPLSRDGCISDFSSRP